MEKEIEKPVMYCIGCNEELTLEEIEAEYNFCTECMMKKFITYMMKNDKQKAVMFLNKATEVSNELYKKAIEEPIFFLAVLFS